MKWLTLAFLIPAIVGATPFDEFVGGAPAEAIAAGRKGVYMCRYTDFKGGCTWLDITDIQGQCQSVKCDLSSETCMRPGMPGVWQSFGPDKGVECQVYASITCESNGMRTASIRYPGTPDFRNWAETLEDVNGNAVSFIKYKCWITD